MANTMPVIELTLIKKGAHGITTKLQAKEFCFISPSQMLTHSALGLAASQLQNKAPLVATAPRVARTKGSSQCKEPSIAKPVYVCARAAQNSDGRASLCSVPPGRARGAQREPQGFV